MANLLYNDSGKDYIIDETQSKQKYKYTINIPLFQHTTEIMPTNKHFRIINIWTKQINYTMNIY